MLDKWTARQDLRRQIERQPRIIPDDLIKEEGFNITVNFEPLGSDAQRATELYQRYVSAMEQKDEKAIDAARKLFGLTTNLSATEIYGRVQERIKQLASHALTGT